MAAGNRRNIGSTDIETVVNAVEVEDPVRSLRNYPNIFRKSLEDDNRLCLGCFMGAEYDDLPATVKTEVQAFADVNVAWLRKVLSATSLTPTRQHVAIGNAVVPVESAATPPIPVSKLTLLASAYAL